MSDLPCIQFISMGIKPKSILIGTIICLCVGVSSLYGQEAIKIMPIGNSITEGYTDGSLPNELLRGYRYGLRYLLKNYGYNIDFVGSQTGGSAYFNDCQHAGIAGTRDQYLVTLLNTGYDERNGVQILVPPRYYLDEYNPDIILLHIGTNDITHEGDAAITNQKVTEILNLIDQYESRANKEVLVFLALIINRVKPWGTAAVRTTTFNNAIKAMAQARIAAGDKIVIVDMEKDAGFEYTYTTDMANDGEGLHPNESGYSKMAGLWFSSITSNFNTPPVIADIPDQTFAEGAGSVLFSLDDFVTDIEDPVDQITWTATEPGTPNLDITIDENRQVLAIPVDHYWNGTQTVVFTATDRGINGINGKSDCDTVVFTVTPVNNAPVITSAPVLTASVGELYSYTLTASDVDNLEVFLSVVSEPDWLSFSAESGLLTGTPAVADMGQNQVILDASDGLLHTGQSYTINVENHSALTDHESAGLTLYPVPARNYLVIDFDNQTEVTVFNVFNSSGILVEKIALPSNTNNYLLDLERFENGLYYIYMYSGSVFYSGKFSVIK
jgi:lysophospholipase L1-like esterase